MVILLFTASDIGASKDVVLIYGRGSGVLPLSLLNIFLIAVFAFFSLARAFSWGRVRVKESFKPGSRLFLLLVFCVVYLLYGAASEVPLREILSPKGIINIINMCLFVYIFVWATESHQQLDKLVKATLSCLFISALYGIVRFIFLGGDPANSYANDLHLNVRLTYQDIGQSILFGFAFAYSALKLLKHRFLDLQAKTFFAVLALLSVLNIVFSYRRNAWVGFLIVAIWLITILDLKKKLMMIMVSVLVITFLGGYVVAKRFSGRNIGSTKYTVTGDFTAGGEVSTNKGRFAELSNATEATLEKHPFFGFGPWGRYGSESELGRFAYFTHSGIVHVLFKTGLVGLYLFCWPLFSLFLWTIKRRKLFPEGSDYKILFDAAFGGILFTVPEILFATPIIIFRHLQITALFIGLIYCAYVFRAPGTESRECSIVPARDPWLPEAVEPCNAS
jgi:hypothetical protein